MITYCSTRFKPTEALSKSFEIEGEYLSKPAMNLCRGGGEWNTPIGLLRFNGAKRVDPQAKSYLDGRGFCTGGVRSQFSRLKRLHDTIGLCDYSTP